MTSVDEILITIPQGIIRGKIEVSCYGDIYYGFHGIPYAKPPVGELRFKAPQPADGWSGIRDGSKSKAAAPSIDPVLSGKYEKEICDEDCLFVNVYMKEIPKPEAKYPVLAWIHGGGYTIGSGNKIDFSPDYLMSHDVVFVAMNYRLGALGFLSLQTLESPGNFGLKDQRLALQWIQKNISYFGGDPDNVTIFGESAGASAVHYHLLSPSCKGLFKQAICQSGSAFNPWGYARHPRECAYLLGKRLGCNAANDDELLNFLRNAPVEDIIRRSSKIILEVEGERIGEKILNFSFVPTSEPESEEAFITKNPYLEKFQLDVPLISGVNEKEMVFVIYSPKQVPSWKEDKDFQELIPRMLNLEKDTELSLTIAKKIREFFFKDGVDLDTLIDVWSDLFFNIGVYQAKKRRINDENIKSNTYSYVYTREWKSSPNKQNLAKAIGLPNEKNGVPHGDEIASLFVAKSTNWLVVKKGSPEYTTMRRMVDFWVNFATNGKPTNEKSEIDWRPTKICEDVYLDIGQDLELKKGWFKERMEFWDEIFKMAGFEI